MKQYLIPENGHFYKANLHCHSTISDGHLTPAQIKEIYKEQGYSVVAYTDHEILAPQNHLADETFLPLNGVEFAVKEQYGPDKTVGQQCHFCCIALEPDNIYTPCYHSSKYVFPKTDRSLATPIPGEPDFEREYTPECINTMVAKAKEAGFFVSYNHPDWSLQDKDAYGKYDAFQAVEIYNNACVTMGYEDYNPKVYDTMLRLGKKLYCLATDDNHNNPDKNWDSFGGFVMIKADKLEYRTITKALEDGHFYASCGPEIHALWMEEGKVHIRCSEAARIHLTTARRRRQLILPEPGKLLTEAVMEVYPEDIYFRITVTDITGAHAATNAYFL